MGMNIKTAEIAAATAIGIPLSSAVKAEHTRHNASNTGNPMRLT